MVLRNTVAQGGDISSVQAFGLPVGLRWYEVVVSCLIITDRLTNRRLSP